MSELSSGISRGRAASLRRTVLGVTKEIEKGKSWTSSYSLGGDVDPRLLVREGERHLMVGDPLFEREALPPDLPEGGAGVETCELLGREEVVVLLVELLARVHGPVLERPIE